MDFGEKRLFQEILQDEGKRGGLVALSATENCLSSKVFAFQDYRMLSNMKILNMFLQD